MYKDELKEQERKRKTGNRSERQTVDYFSGVYAGLPKLGVLHARIFASEGPLSRLVKGGGMSFSSDVR
jgi:hypothetical protein